MITKEQAKQVAQILNLKFERFTFEDFYTGMITEDETEGVKQTVRDLITTGKTALVHLKECCDYYNPYYGLPAMEKHSRSYQVKR